MTAKSEIMFPLEVGKGYRQMWFNGLHLPMPETRKLIYLITACEEKDFVHIVLFVLGLAGKEDIFSFPKNSLRLIYSAVVKL